MAISYANVQVTKVLTLRGNTIQNNRYTGLPGELTVDTEAKTIRIHDGVTPGGNVIQGGGSGTSYGNSNVAAYLTNPSTTLSSLNVTTAGIAQINGTNPGSELVIQTGGSRNFNFRSSGNLEVPGSIIPTANVAYSLGNITHQWKDLFVSNNTIYVGGVPLSIDATGNLTVNGTVIPTIAYVNAQVANVTVDLSAYALNANVTAANVGITGYIDLANTIQSAQVNAANLATIAANLGMRGYVDSVATLSIYGNSNVASYLPTYTGDIAANISKSGKTWTFDSYGNITLPGGATLGITSTNTAILTAATSNTVDIQSSNRSNKLQIDDTMVSVMTGDSHWHFDLNGKLTLPSGANITSYGAGVTTVFDDNGVVIAQQVGVNAFSVTSSTGVRILSGGNPWQFYSDGSSTFPGNLTVAGNLTVNGNVTYISVNNVVISDNIINLADLNPADSLDLGFAAHRTPFGQPLQHTGLVRDASANQWRLFSNVVPAPGTTVDFTNAVYDDLQLGNVTSTGNITATYFIGNTEGLVGSITNLTSLNLTVENIGALISSNGVNIGAGGYNNLLVLPTDVLIQNVPLTVAGNIIANESTGLYITANLPVGGTAQIWNFGADGRLTFPGTPRIDTDSNNFEVQAAESINFEANAVVNIYTDTSGSAYQWQFGSDGRLAFPGTPVIDTDANNFDVIGAESVSLEANAAVNIYTDTGGSAYQWQFGSDGNLTLPNVASVSINYANGVSILSGLGSGGGGNYGNIDVKAFLETDAGPADNFERKIEGYYANLILGDTTKLFSFGNSSKSYFGHDGFANININYARADNSDVRIATNNGAYAWIFDNAGNLTLSGNTFSVNYANGTPVTFSSSSYSNVQVATYLPTYSGNVSALNFVGAIQAQVGSSFSYSTNAFGAVQDSGGVFLPADNNSNAIVAGYTIVGNSGAVTLTVTSATVVTGTPNFVNVTTTPTASSFAYPVTVYTANYSPAKSSTITVGNATVSGNVSATYFLGNGALLTGIVASSGGTNYSNVNVQAYTETMGFKNYSNVNVAAYLNTQGYNLYSNANVASYLPLYGGDISARNITVSGNIALTGNVLQINSAIFYGNTITGFSALYAGIPGYTPIPQVVAQFTSDFNGYAQINSQNLNTGNQASSDFIATANNGTDSAYFVDFGIAGSGYDPSVAANNNAIGTALTPNDAYLYTAGNTAANGGGNLVIGVQTLNKNIRFFAGGVNANNVVLTIQGNGISTAGNVTGTYFVGSGQFLTGLPTAYSNVNVKAYTESMGFANYGNVNVAAYLNATGYNLYSNVNVATYLSSTQAVIANIKLAPSGNIVFADGTVMTTASAGGGSSYSNVNVIAYLAGDITTGNITTVGNITATGYVVTGGGYGNITQVDTITANNVVATANLYTQGNVTAQYLFGNGALLTGIVASGSSYSNVQVATYLPTYSGNIANIRLGVAGVLTFADGTTMTTASAGGGSSYSNVNVAAYLTTYGGAIQSSNVQTTTANIQATTAATNPATGALRVMGGVGVAGAVVAGQLNTTGNLVANTVSVYGINVVANILASAVRAGTINSTGNILAQSIIGTIATASQPSITEIGTLATLSVTGNATVGNLIGTEANTRIIANVYTTTFDIYGNVSFPGNVNVSGLGVTMPARPAFRVNGVSLYNGSQSTANVNLKDVAVSTAYNQGSYFDAATGKFTAPVAGIYEVLLNARVNSSFSGLAQLVVLKNGLNTAGNVVAFWETSSNIGGATHFGVSGTVVLATGDYLSANILVGNVTFDQNDNWSVTYLG